MEEVRTLKELLSHSAKVFQKEAIVVPEEKHPEFVVSYEQFQREVEKISQSLLNSGISKGDVISMVLPNNYSYLALFFAVVSIRAIISPLNPAYKLSDYLYYLKDTSSKAIILPDDIPRNDDSIEAAAQLKIPVWFVKDGQSVELDTGSLGSAGNINPGSVNPEPSDIALLLHTSGTTSLPKGVPLTHLNLTTNIKNISQTYDLSSKDITIIVMPLFHVHGLLGATFSTLLTGGTIVLPLRFSATTFWPQVKQYQVTWYTAVPTIHQILLLRALSKDQTTHDPPPISPGQLRFIRSCSSSLAPIIYQQLVNWLGVPVLEAYAMTEASHQMASNPLPIRGIAKVGSVGRATNIELTIRDLKEDTSLESTQKGEICIRGANVTPGYWNRPDANASTFTPTGWFRTGDEGYLDADGYLFITGRIKELINRGGEKISPLELDGVLLSHPKVKDAVAFAAPDEKYGEQVNCAVTVKEGETVTEKDIMDYVASKLSTFKVPTKVFICTEFPRTATGKIQRRIVAEFFLKPKV
eukprot:TRINITY_DN5233_c0_g1_i1.p1 TRINITY_DN5233_c0_g1~~TRINITY_DN5233_c0_g1_i1.p1  ORF type:complete len:526 (+),score=155.44 TRINITY_DN5233_c0_g1_i1:18-1595(+)